MSGYVIEFWRGNEHVLDYEGEEYRSIEAAHQHIQDLLREMINDPWAEDWTGCRFEVTRSEGRKVLDIPVLAAMSALVRRMAH